MSNLNLRGTLPTLAAQRHAVQAASELEDAAEDDLASALEKLKPLRAHLREMRKARKAAVVLLRIVEKDHAR